MGESKTSDVSPTLLWIGGATLGLVVTAGTLVLGPVLLMVTVMSYDSPSRSADDANVAVGLLLAGLAVIALAGWVLGLAIPLRRTRKLMLIVGGLMFVLGAAASLVGMGIAMSGLAW